MVLPLSLAEIKGLTKGRVDVRNLVPVPKSFALEMIYGSKVPSIGHRVPNAGHSVLRNMISLPF